MKWYITNIMTNDREGELLLLSDEELIEIYHQYGDGQGYLRSGYFLKLAYPMST